MSPEEKFFVVESLKLARSLPFNETRDYLRGLLDSIHEGPVADDVRSALVHLNESELQLSLLIEEHTRKP